MTTLWLRIALIVALIGSLFVGIWDFFQAPSNETAVAALIPTVEKVERAREVTDPVVKFVSEQDEESVAELVRQAETEFNASLAQPGAPVELINEIKAVAAVIEPKGTGSVAKAPSTEVQQEPSGKSNVEPGTPPGIEWYRDN